MKKKVFFIIILFLIFFTNNVFAFNVKIKSISSGVYEDGIFVPKEDSFEGEMSVDNKNGIIELTKIIDNNREGKLEQGAIYEVTHTILSEGLSALLVSLNKKGQKIITAYREEDLGASEIILVGENFYQYVKVSNGKFYLEYGEVIRI